MNRKSPGLRLLGITFAAGSSISVVAWIITGAHAFLTFAGLLLLALVGVLLFSLARGMRTPD